MRYLAESVRASKGIPIRPNAMLDHVYLLCELSPTVTPTEFVQLVKVKTRGRINDELNLRPALDWENTFGIMTVRKD